MQVARHLGVIKINLKCFEALLYLIKISFIIVRGIWIYLFIFIPLSLTEI